MSEAEDRKVVVSQWLDRADADLEAAVRLSVGAQGTLIGVVCFHAQQAVEKYLKAWLAALGMDAPRTHTHPRPVLAVS